MKSVNVPGSIAFKWRFAFSDNHNFHYFTVVPSVLSYIAFIKPTDIGNIEGLGKVVDFGESRKFID